MRWFQPGLRTAALAVLVTCGAQAVPRAVRAGENSGGRRAVVVEEVLLSEGFQDNWRNQWMNLGCYGGSVALGMEENTGGPNWQIGSFPKWIVTQGCIWLDVRTPPEDYDPNVGYLNDPRTDWCIIPTGGAPPVPGKVRTGTLELRDPLSLAPGTYRLSFDLGSPTNVGSLGVDRCVISLDDHFRETFTAAYGDAWKPFTRNIRICEPTSTKIRISHTGPRNVDLDPAWGTNPETHPSWGCRIDNVKFEKLQQDPGLESIAPSRGGNVGQVTLRVMGTGFPSSQPVVSLQSEGLPDIPMTASFVACAGELEGRVDLRGAAPGLRDLVVEFPGLTPLTLPGAFMVEEGGGPQLWATLTCPPAVRAGVPIGFSVVVTNTGNVDSTADSILLVKLPPDAVNGELLIGDRSFALVPPEAGAAAAKLSQRSVAGPGFTGLANNTIVMPALAPTGGRVELIGTYLASTTGPLDVSLVRPPSPGAHSAGRMWGNFWDKKVEEITGRTPLSLSQVAREIVDRVREDSVDILIDFIASAQELERGGLTHAPFAALSPHRATVPLPATLCGHALEHYSHLYSAAEFSFFLEVCFEDRLRAVWLGSPAEPLHGELDTFLQEHSVARTAMEGARERMAELSLPNWEAEEVAKFSSRATRIIEVLVSRDPNEKLGSLGAGDGHAISIDQPIQYRIDFENLAAATAPAASVLIRDVLDTAMVDPTTVVLTGVGIGSLVTPLAGSAAGLSRLLDLRPARDLLVAVEVRLDVSSGEMEWRLTALDPATGREPVDPLIGFLPPNLAPPEGNGFVSFSVRPRPALPSGTVIRNKASIVFDYNAAIETPEWVNTIDVAAPTSTLGASSPAAGVATVPVSWSGQDDASGVLDFSVDVSRTGGPFEPWLMHTSATQGTFTGDIGQTYAFRVRARDQTGNVESKTSADAQVTLTAAPPPAQGGGALGWEVVVLGAIGAARGLTALRRRRGLRSRP